MKLSKDLQAIANSLVDSQKEVFEKLTKEEDKIAYLESIASFASDEVASDEGFVDLDMSDDEEIEIMGVDTLPANKTVVMEFEGTMPLFSTEFKENWEVDVVEGKTVYLNTAYQFKRKDGKRIALFKSPMLWPLAKIPTLCSKEAIRPEKNPMVALTYFGKVTGRDVLEKEYGIKLSAGNSCHIVKVKFGSDVKFDKFSSGTVNYVKNPAPNFGSKEAKLTGVNKRIRDYELQMNNLPTIENKAEQPALIN